MTVLSGNGTAPSSTATRTCRMPSGPRKAATAELHRGHGRRAGRIGRDDRGWSPSPRACPRAPGLSKFQAAFPDRMYDVGIAEQHAMTLATGLALGGQRPARGALLHVPPACLRPGGPRRLPERRARSSSASTGPGSWARTAPATRACSRWPAQRQLPNLVIASPKDEQQLRSLLRTAFAQDHPVRAPLPSGRGLRPAGGRAHDHPRRPGRDCCGGHGPAHRRFRTDRDARHGRRRPAGARGLVRGRHQRALREAPRRGAAPGAARGKQPRGDARGERPPGRLRVRGDGGGPGGGPCRRGAPRRSPCCPSASRPTGSWTTAP